MQREGARIVERGVQLRQLRRSRADGRHSGQTKLTSGPSRGRPAPGESRISVQRVGARGVEQGAQLRQQRRAGAARPALSTDHANERGPADRSRQRRRQACKTGHPRAATRSTVRRMQITGRLRPDVFSSAAPRHLRRRPPAPTPTRPQRDPLAACRRTSPDHPGT